MTMTMTMRKLGQHFLKNKEKIKKIVNSLEIEAGDTVIEIGPGHGELTKAVIEKLSNSVIGNVKIIAIEKDEKLAKQLSNLVIKKLGDKNELKVIAGDALKILPAIITQSPNYPITQLPNYPITNIKIVGNIPFYITGKLLRILGDLITQLPNYSPHQNKFGAGQAITKLPNYPITSIVLTIQKEVAERIVAAPPRMNLLAAITQFWAEPEIIDYIPKKDFSPPPEVDSAIIKLVTKKLSNYVITQLPNYCKFVKLLFKQPRKTILNNLKNGSNLQKEELLKKLLKLQIDPAERPQNLSVEKLKELAELLYN